MCGLTILPLDVANHPKCKACSVLLEPEFNEKTLCWCGKYHNAPSLQDPRYCRRCKGEEIPTGTPRGRPVSTEEEEVDDRSELFEIH